MRKPLLVLALLAFATTAMAQRVSDLNGNHAQLYPTKDKAKDQEPGWAKPGGAGGQNLLNHGGPVILSARVVAIYWGSYWGTQAGAAIRTQVDGFFGQFGTTPEYNTITQYTDVNGNPILQASLSQTPSASWYDSTNPSSTNVTDANVQAEVSKYLTQTGNASASTIYEVFLPSGYYASYGSSDSCGGPNLQFCAYHSNFNSNGTNIKYASMPSWLQRVPMDRLEPEAQPEPLRLP